MSTYDKIQILSLIEDSDLPRAEALIRSRSYAYVTPDGRITKSDNFPWKVTHAESSEEGFFFIIDKRGDGSTPEGLMDMVGNVWEWMENWDEEYKRAHCLRGGSWDHSEDVLRCSYRCWIGPADRVSSVGFRVVRSQS
jgi:hypothetical protein